MSPTSLILFEDFIRVPLGILSIFGIELTADVKKSKRNPTVFAFVSFVCVLILFTQAIIFTHIHFGQKEFFIKLIYDFATMGFAFLCCLKVFMVFIRKNSVLLESMNMLDALLPRDLKMQSKFKIKKNYKNLKSQNFVYEILMPLLLVTFVLSPFLISAFNYLFFTRDFERKLPYFLWFPFGWQGNEPIIYEISYAIALLGATFGVFFHLAIDLLFLGLLTVLCLEFSNLKQKFEEFGKDQTKEELAQLINEHCQLIE